MPPEVPGALSAREAAATAAAIAAAQEPDGAIPWEADRHTDPWNHVEAAMALDVCGLTAAAEAAYEWLLRTQRSDGSWAAEYVRGRITDATADVNFSTYVAAGAWHHFLATLDEAFLREMWPAVERAVEFALAMQAPGGEIWWARDATGRPWPGALVTSSSCIHLSLRRAVAVAERLGFERPCWETAVTRLGAAITEQPAAFEPKARHAMDWYYPVLAGVVDGERARARLAARWDEFVVPGLGVRCVSDRPWVTAAETSELVLALDVLGLDAEARQLFRCVRELRAETGAYWTGATYPDGLRWPDEQPTWTSAAVLLAADALAGQSLTSGFFRGEVAVPDEDLEAVV